MRAVNLLPVEQRTGQSVGVGRSQGGAYAVLVLVGGLALMAFLYGEAKHQVSSRRTQVASLNKQAQQAQAAAERLAPYTSFIALRDQRMQAVETLIDSRFDWAHVLHEFGRVLPAQASISSLSGTIGGASASSVSVAPAASSASTASAGASSGGAAASATPPGSVPTFTLAGCATSQSAVALTLERLRLIDGVKEVTLQSSTAGTASSGGGAAVAGACSGRDASFNATVSFDPLPTAAAASAATKAVSDKTGASAATPAAPTTSTGSGVTAR
jgi:Tfp pilus assembly protein PilN